MNERTKRLADVARTLEEAKAEIQRIAAEEAASGEVSAQRRKMLGLGAGLAAGAAAMAAMQPKEAASQFFGGGIGEAALAGLLYQAIVDGITDTIREPIDVTREVTEIAFQLFRDLGVPSSFLTLLHRLLNEYTGAAGSDSMSLPERVPEALEISWPEFSVNISRDRKEQNRLTAQATRARVTEACGFCGEAWMAQQQLALDDEILVEEARAAAREGNATTIWLANAILTHTNSQRLSQLIGMINQQTALQAGMVMHDEWVRDLADQATDAGDAGSSDGPLTPGVVWR